MNTQSNHSLPSLNAIRVFEAAARQQNFTAAAEELHITQGAVSRQIKLLEQQLGCALFHRSGPLLKLSAEGLEYQRVTEEALAILRRGTANIRRRHGSSELTVSLLPSFANNWLLPKLPTLETRHPDLLLRLALSYQVVDFEEAMDVDVAIRLGRGDWPGLYSIQLTEDELFPVCSPTIAAGLETPADLLKQRLVQDRSIYDEWHRWFRAAGLEYAPGDTLNYEDVNLQIRAAIEGQGVSLSRKEFVEDYLASGQLVRPFETSILSEFHYYFVCPPQRLTEANVRAFHNWIKEWCGGQ